MRKMISARLSWISEIFADCGHLTLDCNNMPKVNAMYLIGLDPIVERTFHRRILK
jgi:hypothetical protein